MANGLMGLSNLLGQSSNAQSGGLMGGGVFSQPQSRSQRRARLLSDAIQGAQTSYGRSGAAIGGLLGMGLRAGAEGLGLIDAPPEEQRNEAIRQVQQEVQERGLDPLSNTEEFINFTAQRFNDLGYQDLAIKTIQQGRQLTPEQPEVDPATFYNPDTEEYVQGGYVNGVPVTSEGRPLGEGFVERDYEPDASTRGKARNVRTADGRFIRGIERPDGTLVDTQGNRLPETATIVGLSLQAGQETDLPQGVQSELNSAQLGVENYTDLANEAIGVFNENPNVNTLAAEGGRLLRNLKTEFDSILSVTGVELSDDLTKEQLFDLDRYESTFDKIGLENAALKPLYLSLAIQNAQAEADQTGRALSDTDITRFLEQQGTNASDPEVATEILRRNAGRLQRKFKRQYKIETGSEFDQELPPVREYNPSGSQGAPDPAAGNGGDAAAQAIEAGPQALVEYLNNASDEELNNLSPEVQSQIEQILSGSQ